MVLRIHKQPRTQAVTGDNEYWVTVIVVDMQSFSKFQSGILCFTTVDGQIAGVAMEAWEAQNTETPRISERAPVEAKTRPVCYSCPSNIIGMYLGQMQS